MMERKKKEHNSSPPELSTSPQVKTLDIILDIHAVFFIRDRL